ncbi:GIY-YIG nuclease family protein [Patescibacteria group bacterium]|nr:GIY-YIG nuclease family protein [Patescibacteria group bacterium]
MYYFYVLKSKLDNELYYGISGDLKKRVVDHNTGKVKSTKSRRPLSLVYYEAYISKTDARKRELEIKNKGQQREFLKVRIKNSLKK